MRPTETRGHAAGVVLGIGFPPPERIAIRSSHIPSIYAEFATARHSHRAPVTMLRLNSHQRTALGDTLRALANLAVAAFVLSQFVARQSVSVALLASGVAAWIALVAMAMWLIGEE